MQNNEDYQPKTKWQPEGSWIMLDDTQQNLIHQIQDIHRRKDEENNQGDEDSAALNEIANEMDNIALEGAEVHHDACNSMEEAELSLGLSLRLGVNADELNKTNQVVKSVSNQDFKPLDVILQENETKFMGQSSPSSVSSTSSIDEQNIDEPIHLSSRSFSPAPVGQELKYGGRAPPVPGALAPPARGFTPNLEVSHEERNTEFSWVQTSCKLENGSPQDARHSNYLSVEGDKRNVNKPKHEDANGEQNEHSVNPCEHSNYSLESASIVVVASPECDVPQRPISPEVAPKVETVGRRFVGTDQAKRLEKRGEKTDEVASWAQNFGLDKQMTYRTVVPLVLSHVVTLLVGFYIGRQYSRQTTSASSTTEISAPPTAVN